MAAGQAGHRLLPARGGRPRVWRLSAGYGGRAHRRLCRPHHRELGGFPRQGRGLDRPFGRAGLRRYGQPQHPQRDRRAALRSGPPALGVRIPAQVCGLPEPDRAVVEDPALFGSQRAPLRDLGADRRGRPARHRVLEPAQAPLHLGPQTAAPHLAPPRGRRRAKVRNNLADAPLRFPQFSSEASMRFGWLTLSLSPSPEEDADRIDQQIEQVHFAERLGFGDVWLTEHYFTGASVYNDALLFASAVAMREDRPPPLCSGVTRISRGTDGLQT